MPMRIGENSAGQMRMSNMCVVKAGLLGAASTVALSLLSVDVHAQSANLPAVTVDAPQQQQQARRARPQRNASRARSTRRRVAAPAPRQAVAPEGSGRVAVERGNGPVHGYLASQSVTGTKTDTPILETPQSISVVTQDQITAQGAQSVNDALQYTPGVSLESFGSNTFFDLFKLRGFDAPRYLDGMRLPMDNTTFAVPRVETYGLERLEVLKGPSSGLYGATDPGGLINMVSKRPQDTPHYSVEGTFGSFNRFQGAFDIGGPVDKNGEFLYRIVGLGRQSDTQTDFMTDNKIYIAPSLTWRPTNDTSFTILSQYSKIDNKGYQQYVPGQVTFLSNPNGPVPYSRYLGEPGTDGFKLEQASIGYEFTHRFDNNLQFRQNFRFFDVSNNLSATRSEGMLSDRLVARTYNYVQAHAQNYTLDNQLQADFRTGPLTHKVLAGFDYINLKSSTDYRSAAIAPIDAYAPVYGTAVPSFDSLSPFILRDDKLSQAGLYLQDQIKLDRWTLSLTGRQDWVSTEFTSLAAFPPAGSYVRNDSAQTGRIGLNYLFDFGLAPYVSYSTSFTPNLGSDLSGNSFKPTTGEGTEIGVKFKPNGMNLMLTAALFDIDQDNVLTADATNPFFNVQTDAARVRGFEFEARGNVTREFEIIAGYSHLDPKVTKSSAGNVGKYLQNTALEQASLWGKYTWQNGPLAGFGIGAGVRYVGKSYGDAGNTFEVPSYTLFDAALSYDFAYMRPDLKGLTMQVSAKNLADRYYVASCLTGLAYCAMGTGRTVLGTLKYSWN
jgi:iron complex outermembrane receptor protein